VTSLASSQASASSSTLSVTASRKYQLHRGSDLLQARVTWLVKNVIPATGLGLVYGAPGVAKSFLLLDLCCAVAEGTPWFGHRTLHSPVVYCCLEGSNGFVGRIRAWETANARPLPELVRVVTEPVSLLTRHDVTALVRAIHTFGADMPAGLGAPVVIFDTLNRAMSHGDENLAADMGCVLDACAFLSAQTGGIVMLTHHVGKDSERGPRGHSSLKPAVDVALLVSRAGKNRAWEVNRLKDGEEGLRHAFELQTIRYALDDEGEAMLSCVVAPSQTLEQEASKTTDIPPPLRMALRTLRSVLPAVKAGQAFAKEIQVNLEVWREVFYKACTATSLSGKRNAFVRARRNLRECGYITEEAEMVSVAAEAMTVLQGLGG
jgi:putative DNA primase/helicase